MSLFTAFQIAGSGATAQGQRLNVVASNLANADSTAGPDGQTYKSRQVVFEALPAADGAQGAQGVRVQQVTTDNSPPRRLHDPGNPLADADGYVSMPNVSVAEEMVNMISAARGYENNIEVMNTAKTLLEKTLQLGN
ncbi:MAG TPA: flagellar basal body rod protein FlgC [Burkholderiales bacterium]|jgi:flagellar basal-body rod protein FlgC|nr:flagellar basal body rod protein FlgC [Burkholderiales bacterium]